jgi:hypothetical protein
VGVRKFLLQIDENELESAVRRFAQNLSSAPSGRQFIALDGKALRGSASRLDDMIARHIVSAFDQHGLIVLGHVEVAEKSNEIPAAQDLIESLGLEGRVALSKKTLALALEKGADVLVQVKGNQPTLLAACEDLACYCAAAQCNVQHDKGHGRIETRTVRIWSMPENWLEDD